MKKQYVRIGAVIAMTVMVGMLGLNLSNWVYAQTANPGPAPSGTGANTTISPTNGPSAWGPQYHIHALLQWLDANNVIDGLPYGQGDSNVLVSGGVSMNYLQIPQSNTVAGSTSNAWAGQATLAAGAATVLQNAFNTNDLIFLTMVHRVGGKDTNVWVSAETPGTSFVITASDTSAASTNYVNWFIVHH
jgi:hypothetical protein